MRGGGRRLEIEVKGEGGRQSDQQKKWQRMIEHMGGVYVLAYTVEDAVGAVTEALDDAV